MTCSCRLVDRSDDVVRRLDFERDASCPAHGDAAIAAGWRWLGLRHVVAPDDETPTEAEGQRG